MTIRTAVIPAAGLGTRFLPITKSVPKELMPILDKPMLQYVVEEAAEAGFERVVIVSRRARSPLPRTSSRKSHWNVTFWTPERLTWRKRYGQHPIWPMSPS